MIISIGQRKTFEVHQMFVNEVAYLAHIIKSTDGGSLEHCADLIRLAIEVRRLAKLIEARTNGKGE